MLKNLFICFISILPFCAFSANDTAENEKDFNEFNSVLSLPDNSWRWSEQTLSGTLCAATDGKGNILAFFAAEDKSFHLNRTFIETFEQGFFSGGESIKLRSGILTFESLPCYELIAELNKKKTVAVRIFSANGIFYRIDVISDIGSDMNVDKVFSCFKFKKAPTLINASDNNKKGESTGGFIIGLIVGVILITYMFKVIFTKKLSSS